MRVSVGFCLAIPRQDIHFYFPSVARAEAEAGMCVSCLPLLDKICFACWAALWEAWLYAGVSDVTSSVMQAWALLALPEALCHQGCANIPKANAGSHMPLPFPSCILVISDIRLLPFSTSLGLLWIYIFGYALPHFNCSLPGGICLSIWSII